MFFRSIKTKLIVAFSVMLLIVCLGVGTAAFLVSTFSVNTITDSSLSELLEATTKLVQSKIEVQQNALETLAANHSLRTEAVSIEEKLSFLHDEKERGQHLSIGLGDKDGNIVYTDNTSTNLFQEKGYQYALQGNSSVSDLVVNQSKNRTEVTFYTPVFSLSGEIQGVIAAVRDGEELSKIVEHINFGESGAAYIIDSQGTMIAHSDRNLVFSQYNVFNEVKTDPTLQPLADIMMKMTKGQSGIDEYTFQNVLKYVGYAPIPNTEWSLALAVPKSEVMKTVQSLTLLIAVAEIAYIVIGLLITMWISARIANPVRVTAEHLEVMGTGNFSETIPDSLLKLRDETGMLAKAACNMQSAVKDIVTKVASDAGSVGQTLITIHHEMEKLDRSVEEIQAVTEQFSAGSQQLAASAEEMTATSTEIERAVESIATKAQEGAVAVGNVTEMAEEMKQNALESREKAVEMYERTKAALQTAIRQSEQVNQINELSDSILEITAQTNLLSLNASIEAARAGEAGKGFAVVANEIRGLADSSKDAVARIQEVTKVILEAVTNLATHSNEILTFVDQKVLTDYEYFVGTSQQSSENMENISSVVMDFSASSEELLASIQNMVQMIEEISRSSNEAASGTASIAEEATSIVSMSNKVITISEAAKAKSDDLMQNVGQFKI